MKKRHVLHSGLFFRNGVQAVLTLITSFRSFPSPMQPACASSGKKMANCPGLTTKEVSGRIIIMLSVLFPAEWFGRLFQHRALFPHESLFPGKGHVDVNKPVMHFHAGVLLLLHHRFIHHHGQGVFLQDMAASFQGAGAASLIKSKALLNRGFNIS